MRNNRDSYEHVYIFLIRKQKLRNLANDRPQNLSTLKLTNGFSLYKRYLPGIAAAKNSSRSHEDSRSKAE